MRVDQTCVVVANHQSSLDVLGKIIDILSEGKPYSIDSFSILGMFGKLDLTSG